MRKLGLLAALIAVFAVIVAGNEYVTTDTNAGQFSVDTSAQAQANRADVIDQLQSNGMVEKTEGARLFVGDKWRGATVDDKRFAAQVVFAYLHTQDQRVDYMPIMSPRTGEQVGSFGEYGLRLD